MSKLEELKAIAAARTKGEWKSADQNKSLTTPEEDICYFEYISQADIEFIAMASNNIDKLLAVAECAKKYVDDDDGWVELCRAIHALEAE